MVWSGERAVRKGAYRRDVRTEASATDSPPSKSSFPAVTAYRDSCCGWGDVGSQQSGHEHVVRLGRRLHDRCFIAH